VKFTTITITTIAAVGLAACGSAAVRPPTLALTVVPTPTAVPATTPIPSPPVVANPLAVVGSENAGIGAYTLGLVNAGGTVVAGVTANTPSDYYSVGGNPSITSTSDSRLYYEDGNNDIDYLTATGQHGVAFTVSRPTGAEVAFAVSPDDTRVAVAVLTNWQDGSGNGGEPPYTSHMYLMAMGGGIQQTLFDGTGTSSTAPLTWPVGWDGANLVVAQVLPADFTGYTPGTGPCGLGVDCSSQLRVFNPTNKSFGPPLCAEEGGVKSTGSPTAGGIACVPIGTYGDPAKTLESVSWSGVVTSFGTNIPGGCMLSPQGAVMACPSDLVEDETIHTIPAHIFRAGGVVQKITNPLDFQLIGWMDGNDVVVTTGGSIAQGGEYGGLAVENIVTGRRIAVTLAASPNPFSVRWQFFGVIPGAL
jgi:hypothetical protein